MSDERPVLPWLEPGSEASADVRAVLASARSDGLSAAQVDALARKVLALSAPAAIAASSAPAASSAGVSLGAKLAVVTLVLSLGGAGAWIASARAKLDARAPATARAQAPSRVSSAGSEPSTSGATVGDGAPRVMAPSVSVAPRAERRAARSAVHRADAGVIATESAVSPVDDAALLHRAAAALRGGATREAIALVARHRRWFAESALSEERERIEIEALVRDGQTESARGAAARFRRQFPGSAQQPRIDALLARDAAP